MPKVVQVDVEAVGVRIAEGAGPVTVAVATPGEQVVVMEMSPELAQTLLMGLLERLAGMPYRPAPPRPGSSYTAIEPQGLEIILQNDKSGALLLTFGPAVVPIAVSGRSIQALYDTLSKTIGLLRPPAGSA